MPTSRANIRTTEFRQRRCTLAKRDVNLGMERPALSTRSRTPPTEDIVG
jgi:hypothetical protein